MTIYCKIKNPWYDCDHSRPYGHQSVWKSPRQVIPALYLTFIRSTCSSSRLSGFSFLIVSDNCYFNSNMFSCVGNQSNIHEMCFFKTKKQATLNAHHSYAVTTLAYILWAGISRPPVSFSNERFGRVGRITFKPLDSDNPWV